MTPRRHRPLGGAGRSSNRFGRAYQFQKRCFTDLEFLVSDEGGECAHEPFAVPIIDQPCERQAAFGESYGFFAQSSCSRITTPAATDHHTVAARPRTRTNGLAATRDTCPRAPDIPGGAIS